MFEERKGQWEMMNFVQECFAGNEHALIEAGTGIGKTYAYLVPAVFYASVHHHPVIISTNTVTLQQQIIEKMCPF